jgi:AraC-like DNA-binding protein
VEINIITEGTGFHKIYNNRIPVQPGSVFIIPANTPHTYTRGENLTIRHILIRSDFFTQYSAQLNTCPGFYFLFQKEPYLRSLTNYSPYLFALKNKNFDTFNVFWDMLVQKGLDLPSSKNDEKSSENLVFLNGWLLSLIAFFGSIYAMENQSSMDTNLLHITNVVEYISIHYNENISLETLAKNNMMSVPTLMRAFKTAIGTSPANFIIMQRISRAKILLKNSQLPITTIASETGFFDNAHFTRMFKKATGMSPTEYRNK